MSHHRPGPLDASLRPFLRCVFDAQHFNDLANNSVNQNIVRMRHELARPFNSSHSAHGRVLIEEAGLLDQQVAELDRRPWVVLGDV